ncbi:uncharacterized protein EI90DRAFT_1937638 [Cantharellus anzutake]|uniref:uncharacterized protein n=1 Tax=Cantharellus anzutake TaxID=1750568 RepID=UPI0019034E9E|nr:uncharacterized protein EI90DRAFT_1937638 [Cantharellus anzutake]KAF8326342.1 hypothetical protein EI90DRAFT_1937638 [Cantharellus anzutake]
MPGDLSFDYFLFTFGEVLKHAVRMSNGAAGLPSRANTAGRPLLAFTSTVLPSFRAQESSKFPTTDKLLPNLRSASRRMIIVTSRPLAKNSLQAPTLIIV